MQSLPSLSSMRLPVGTGFVSTTAVTGGRLSVDATRELAKCANGELVSHDVVRDGIDALLQLKRASYDLNVDIQHQERGGGGYIWGQEKGALRTRPDDGSSSCFPPTPWSMNCGVKDESSSDEDEDEEEEEEEEDCSTCDNTPAPIQRKIRRTTIPKTRNPPPLKRKPVKPPPTNRPPTIWHPRKSELSTTSFPTPESPKSKISADGVESEAEEEEVEEETTGPAVLHFSCLQCHRAKKRCNRTRPCGRCISRGMENECRYPDKHDPRSVLRACLRCWQTKKKCDRKQPSCGKCDKVGVKCVYRRENQIESPESPIQGVQVPTPTLTMSPPPVSRHPSDASSVTLSEGTLSRKRKTTDDMTSENRNTKRTDQSIARRRETRNSKSDEPVHEEIKETVKDTKTVEMDPPKRVLRSRK